MIHKRHNHCVCYSTKKEQNTADIPRPIDEFDIKTENYVEHGGDNKELIGYRTQRPKDSGPITN